MYKVFFTRRAEKELDKLAKKDAKKVVSRLQKFGYPFPANFDIRKMIETKGFYRLRVGRVRVLFEVDSERQEIWIRQVGYRGRFYR